MRNFLYRLMPFIALGVTICILIIGFIIFSYVLIFGALIGLFLFAVKWLQEKFTAKKHSNVPQKAKHKGRIINHDDIR